MSGTGPEPRPLRDLSGANGFIFCARGSLPGCSSLWLNPEFASESDCLCWRLRNFFIVPPFDSKDQHQWAGLFPPTASVEKTLLLMQTGRPAATLERYRQKINKSPDLIEVCQLVPLETTAPTQQNCPQRPAAPEGSTRRVLQLLVPERRKIRSLLGTEHSNIKYEKKPPNQKHGTASYGFLQEASL